MYIAFFSIFVIVLIPVVILVLVIRESYEWEKLCLKYQDALQKEIKEHEELRNKLKELLEN